jgi:hypothetical protein
MSNFPVEISAALEGYPKPVRKRLIELRRIILKTVTSLEIGEVIETTKWGEPAYLPKKARLGTTLRIGTKRGDERTYRLYVNCQTSLIETFKTLFPELEYEGNRGVVFPVTQPPPADIVSIMVEATLTYHLRKRLSRLGSVAIQ